MPNISVAAFEAKVLELEDVVIRIRAPAGSAVNDYEYERKSADNQSVADWLEGRIKPLIDNHEVVVIDGHYTTPHGRTRLRTLRSSYER